MSFWKLVDKALEFVPIAGTIKDGVEALVLECEGKDEEAKIKALEAAIDLAVDAITVGTMGSGYEVAEAGKIAAEMVIKEIAERGASESAEAIIMEATKHGFTKRSGRMFVALTESTSAKYRAKQAIAKKYKMKLQEPSTEHKWPTLKDPKRGHHVINNDVRQILPKIIRKFLDTHSGYFHNKTFNDLVNEKFITETFVYAAHEFPLCQTDKERNAVIDARIEMMTVYTPDGEQHIDSNDVDYGVAVAALRVLVHGYMTHLFSYLRAHPDEIHELDQQCLTIIDWTTANVNDMNTTEVYVDHQALEWWLAEGGVEAEYEEARDSVVQMLSTLTRSIANRSVTWVRELFYVYKELNEMD